MRVNPKACIFCECMIETNEDIVSTNFAQIYICMPLSIHLCFSPSFSFLLSPSLTVFHLIMVALFKPHYVGFSCRSIGTHAAATSVRRQLEQPCMPSQATRAAACAGTWNSRGCGQPEQPCVWAQASGVAVRAHILTGTIRKDLYSED